MMAEKPTSKERVNILQKAKQRGTCEARQTGTWGMPESLLLRRGHLEVSKADLVLTEIKLGIDVLQEDVTDDPEVYIDAHNQSLIRISQSYPKTSPPSLLPDM